MTDDPRIPGYGNEAAYPRPAIKRLPKSESDFVLLPEQWGLTKRELFAAMAMQGLAPAYAQGGDFMEEHVAKGAVRVADALLAELAKVTP